MFILIFNFISYTFSGNVKMTTLTKIRIGSIDNVKVILKAKLDPNNNIYYIIKSENIQYYKTYDLEDIIYSVSLQDKQTYIDAIGQLKNKLALISEKAYEAFQSIDIQKLADLE